MSHWVYSSEALPNTKMMGKAGYTPEYIMWNGIQLPQIPEKEWTAMPDSFPGLRHWDWRDKQGHRETVRIEDFKGIMKRFEERGVIFLDHEPTKAEMNKLEAASQELNLKFRARCIEFFEAERDNAKARQGRYDPTPYIDECYDLLGFPKPYSVDTLKSQRMPGHEAAERIATAIADALKANREPVAATK